MHGFYLSSRFLFLFHWLSLISSLFLLTQTLSPLHKLLSPFFYKKTLSDFFWKARRSLSLFKLKLDLKRVYLWSVGHGQFVFVPTRRGCVREIMPFFFLFFSLWESVNPSSGGSLFPLSRPTPSHTASLSSFWQSWSHVLPPGSVRDREWNDRVRESEEKFD